jgi:hypothetical protein
MHGFAFKISKIFRGHTLDLVATEATLSLHPPPTRPWAVRGLRTRFRGPRRQIHTPPVCG